MGEEDDYSQCWYSIGTSLPMYIMTGLDAIKANDIRLFLLERNFRHLISQFEVRDIDFPEGAQFRFLSTPTLFHEHVVFALVYNIYRYLLADD